MNFSFCLISEPWIPCRYLDGSIQEVGIQRALVDAHEIAEVIDASPLVTSALLRLLFAIVHRVLDGPPSSSEWLARWEAGRFEEAPLNSYLDTWRERFDLFHPRHPFFQVADLTLVDSKGRPVDPAPISVLSPERASGNNTTLFDHSLDQAPTAATPAEAARSLVAAQAWSLGGGKGPTSNRWSHPYASHAPLAGALQVFVAQPNLFRTLIANLTSQGFRDAPLEPLGTPLWERDEHRDPSSEETAPDGLLDWMTFPARYLRLLAEQDEGGALVRTVYFAPGLKPRRDIRDPYTAWRPLASGEGLTPVGLQPGRAVWRDSASLFAWQQAQESDKDRGALRPAVIRQVSEEPYRRTMDSETILGVHTYGLANDKAKPLLWAQESLPVALRVISDPYIGLDLIASLGAIERAWRELRASTRRLIELALATSGRSVDRGEIDRQTRALLAEDEFWSQVGSGFEPYMLSVEADPQTAHVQWLDRTRKVALDLFQRVSDRCPVPLARRIEAHSRTFPALSSRLTELCVSPQDDKEAAA